MARHGFRHVVVADGDDRLVGIVSQNDLFELQRVGVKEISSDIRHAQDLEGIRQSAVGIRGLAHNMLAQGLGAEALSHFISTLNDLLTIRLIELTQAEFELPQVKWCWITMGSQGRFEQTFSTDQDNGIIFEAEDAGQVTQLKRLFVPFAQAVNQKLDACGFALCKGGIMAGNPHWCLSLSEWQDTFVRWIHEAQPQALLNAAIFFDLRPLFGAEELADALRATLLNNTACGALFLRQMVQNALQCQPPLGVFRDFVYDDSKEFSHTIDMKMYGSRPFVDSARIMSLANHVAATSTAERLRAVSDKVRLGGDDVSAIIEGFYFIQLVRMRHQDSMIGPSAAANRVNPEDLNELDRQILKGAFKQARKLQTRLALDYRL
jgi:CBS domain-containing protein